MGKIRVYEIAKEVNIDSKTLVTKLQSMGYDVKSHASALEEAEGNEAIERIKADTRASVVEKRVSTGVIRRRASPSEEGTRPPVLLSPASGPDEAPEIQQDNPALEPVPPPRIAIPAPPAQGGVRVRSRVEPAVVVVRGPERPKPTKPVAAPASPAGVPERPTTPAPSNGAHAAPAAPAPASPATKTPTAPEASAPTAAVRRPRRPGEEEKSDYYQAQVIRRATPEDQVRLGLKESEAKPTGIRVLKVVPGKEGRGHEFIDISKTDKGRRRASTREDRADLNQQLFDVLVTGYVPGGRRRRPLKKVIKKAPVVVTPKEIKRVVKMEACQIASSELAKRMGVKLRDLNQKWQELGEEIADVNTEDRSLDIETATVLAQALGHVLQDISFKEEAILQQTCSEEPSERASRPPIVTVMGHVDHGKTSILDAIRKTNVADGEEGGITQHIGAYEVILPKGSISFIDTPGHEAFAAMRSRGASVTDIVVLVVAADDGVMPQTIEAIHHAQAAKVPIIVAINKTDLPGSQPDRVKQALTEYHMVPEEWGGDTPMLPVSAKTKAGLTDLLDNILVQSEVLALTYNPHKAASGSILEARLDRGRGPLSTLLIRDGVLKQGDTIVVGTTFGRVRSMFNHEGKTIDHVQAGRPVQVQGLTEVPQAGEVFYVVSNDREARKLVEHRLEELRAKSNTQTARLTLEDFYEKLQGTEKLELRLIVKADVQGSAEAVRQAVEKLSHPKVSIKVLHHGVGAISETDVNLAAASRAVLLGFNIREDAATKRIAQSLKVEIRNYKIIYELLDDVRLLQSGMLPATIKENVIGRAEVRDLFNVPKVGTVAGVAVLDGKLQRSALIRLLRDSVEVHTGRMASLKRFKEDVREVNAGLECGIGLEGFNDIKRGDIIEAFLREEERPTLM